MKKSDPTETDQVSRRAALGLGVTLGAAAIGCGSSDESVPPADLQEGTPPAPTSDPPTKDPPPPVKPPEEEPKLGPKELLAGVEHIVVLMMENRSFDHYLGALALDAAYANKTTVAGLTGSETNPAPDGSTVKVFKMNNFTPEDPPHGWAAAHKQFNEGKNDGFVKEHAGASQNEAMGYHDRSQIPLYYWFADNFAVCDNWFASVLGPTWPNRFYLHATTSKGKKDNSPFFTGAPESIWEALKAKGLSYKNYAAGVATFYLGGFVGKVPSLNPSAPISEFFDAAKTGKLPAFSMIDPDYQASDDHPSHNIQRGQAFVASVYKALAESPAWSKTLLIVTYDENGGFYDHVAPPVVQDDNAEFTNLGFRVPTFVIGAMVKKGYVSKVQMEHSSVAATLRTRFDIKNLSTRMQATNDITDCIDPKKVKAPAVPPLGMPQVAMTMQAALWDNVGDHSQPLLGEMVEQGIIPAVSSTNHQERIGSWLKDASRLGAVRIIK